MPEERVPLGRSDVLVPRLGCGVMTWGEARGLARLHPAQTAYGGGEGRDAERLAFEASVAAGVTLFDTAQMYAGGASERRLGELAHGTDVLVATKFPGTMWARPDSIPASLDASLERLRRASIDVFQHHFPSRLMPVRPVMQQLAAVVGSGKARAVGVSNYSAEQLRLAHRVLADLGVAMASNQVQYSLLHRAPEIDGVLDACQELGVTLIAYQPMASGALTGKYGPGTRPKGLRRFLPPFRGRGLEQLQPVVSLLREIGTQHGASPGQVALRWLVENPLVLPIPGARNGTQAAANAKALTFSLDPAEVAALDKATTAWRR